MLCLRIEGETVEEDSGGTLTHQVNEVANAGSNRGSYQQACIHTYYAYKRIAILLFNQHLNTY